MRINCYRCDTKHGVLWGTKRKRPKPHEWAQADGPSFWSGDLDVTVRCPKGIYGTSVPLTPFPGVPKPREAYGHFGPSRPKVYPDEWCGMCMSQGALPGHCNHGAGASCCNCEGTREWVLDGIPADV